MARPKKYTELQLIEMLEKYIKATTIPILAEFAYKNDVNRSYLYSLDSLKDTIKKLIDKKEAQLERLALDKVIDKTMAIFSLKQLGWKDINDSFEDKNIPEIPIKIIAVNRETASDNKQPDTV